MKILIVDNYDSFTYNIVDALRRLGVEPDVKRNDRIDVDSVADYDKIILSPGPGIPEEAGLLLPLLKRYATEKPILGICLGHQAIGEAFGAKLVNLPKVYHGLKLPVEIIEDDYLFAGMEKRQSVGRYHSWAIDRATIPDCIEVTAVDDDGIVMAIRHRDLDIRGVQFHPESIMTENGLKMLENWLSRSLNKN